MRRTRITKEQIELIKPGLIFINHYYTGCYTYEIILKIENKKGSNMLTFTSMIINNQFTDNVNVYHVGKLHGYNYTCNERIYDQFKWDTENEMVVFM